MTKRIICKIQKYIDSLTDQVGDICWLLACKSVTIDEERIICGDCGDDNYNDENNGKKCELKSAKPKEKKGKITEVNYTKL